MPDQFMNVRFHVAEKSDEELKQVIDGRRSVRGSTRSAVAAGSNKRFDNDEAAARFYLSRVLNQDKRAAVRGLTAPERPNLVPDMVLQETQVSQRTRTKLVRFEQTQSSIPIFGSQVVVEIDQKRQLIAINGRLAAIEQYIPLAAISPQQALESIAELASIAPDDLKVEEQPATTLYNDKKTERWHLAYFFKNVYAAPKEIIEKARERETDGHGLGMSPRALHPIMNYLVDAHDGAVLFYYSATPTLTKCKGTGELGESFDFYGEKVGNLYLMHDAKRNIKTYDLQLGDILSTGSFPKEPVSYTANDFSEATHYAAVSAHANAIRVYDFYKSVLQRDGIDDKDMELISVVNCTYPEKEMPPEWHNAFWWKGRMWYGQVKNGKGGYSSFSRYLDIIAHELTHGVTEHTARLVYAYESGALDESLSDIFGIIISNWSNVKSKYDKPNTDVATWKWEIGPGLGKKGLPLRDMSNPKRTGDPDHWKKRSDKEEDSGGVHINSNIHNKAAYNVFTAKDESGQFIFSAEDVAVMYYESLSRLPGTLSTFSDMLQTLMDFAATYFAGDPEELRLKKIEKIRTAYEQVGITPPKN